ncbi:hypothetical protein H0A36_27790 [Endozoicomonas sp. SM1973]|uniref:DUF2846 domain-containing protein n=1 Tax=Spartinivicinus marinus TaxID=2994442 RepID=A0A853IH25_9GAMM|nr:hypothetical protein [Spartinivicinus marinus]MCX4030473.1 hypothetical protein [Spartinivicinus marinus]NYZ69818.1 hypothetical protein [Spartinivicinus marinus]
MQKIKLLMLIFWLVFLGACTATGPIYKPHNKNNDNNAIIYIYRYQDPSLIGGGELVDVPYIYVNDQKLSRLRLLGYSVYETEPGPVRISVRLPIIGIPANTLLEYDLLAKPGQSYYLSLNYFDTTDYIRVLMNQVPDDKAKQQLKSLRLQ